MSIRYLLNSGVCSAFLFFSVFLGCFPGKQSIWVFFVFLSFFVLVSDQIILLCKMILKCVCLVVTVSFWGAGLVLSADVTLRSMEINKTHEWLNSKPTVYFKCKDENMTVLPDVKEAHVLYNFKGQESWQVRDRTFFFGENLNMFCR